MADDRTVKPVSFSHSDPHEAQLLDYLRSQGTFSRYVKRLIARDMEGGSVPQRAQILDPDPQDDRRDASSFL